MGKITKFAKISLSILYIVVIFLLIFKNEKITLFYDLPKWLIPSIFFISIIYICYKYIIYIIKENKTETEMISIINHTFRTPLTGIIWHTKELEKNLPQNEKLLYLQNINNSANKVLNILDILIGIKDIKDTSSYFFEAVSIREIIEKSIKKYRENINKKNITFQFSLSKEIPLLTVDLKKISFVIDTIIENAISYTKKDGKILVDCISTPSKLTLYISDTGIGLGMIDKMRIFSKFYRNHQAKLMNTDGMGLKLYLGRQIIKRHHGKIYAKSNGLNEGTTLFVELPFQK
ncbi:MAG: HAMP domain-containing sensor histidine kinase [Candidatus Paceibacterota bacterium]|jgi:two-component system sensor histidine kinase VicK